MAQLTQAYRAARAPDEREVTDPPALEPTLAALCARGRAAHPDLPLDDTAFVAHLARCGTPLAEGPGPVHAEDLYAACAALAGGAQAIALLQRTHRPSIAGYLRAIDGPCPTLDDVEPRLWQAMLAGDRGQPPKLATYTGRTPLGAFLGVAGQRMALDSRRRDSAERATLNGLTAAAEGVGADAEMNAIKQHNLDAFELAVHDALALLEDHDRMLLRMHIVDGLPLDRIARVYRVTEPTVSRWVQQARQAVVGHTRRLLRERQQMSESELDAPTGPVVSRIDISVSRALRAPR